MLRFALAGSNTTRFVVFCVTLLVFPFVLPKTLRNAISMAIADPKVPKVTNTLISMYYSPELALQILDNECPADPFCIEDLVGMYTEGWDNRRRDDIVIDATTWHQVEEMHIDSPKCFHNFEVRARMEEIDAAPSG